MNFHSEDSLIAVIDQGTSSTRCLIISTQNGLIITRCQIPISSFYSSGDRIEMNAIDIYQSTLNCLNMCIEQMNNDKLLTKNIVALGITNQRETIVAWNKLNGQPLAPAIVWSDARTAELVIKYTKIAGGNANAFQQKTGLPIHSYFSALKIRWLLDNVDSVRQANLSRNLMVGTVDSWLVWNLTNKGAHVTDVTNASRTLLFNISTLEWDAELCSFFDIDLHILPKVKPSSDRFGLVSDPKCLLTNVPICGLIGDQQASLVGQTWLYGRSNAPTVKVTYGTGGFMLWGIGEDVKFSNKGLLTTIAYQMGPTSPVCYALEGSISFAGATINWLKDNLKLFDSFDELESCSNKILKNYKQGYPDPCYLVPGFSGLFCPWWQESARAIFAGLTADITSCEMTYAGLRSIAYQTYDLFCVADDSQSTGSIERINEIMVDGGISKSNALMQSLSDILGISVRRHHNFELMTVLGAGVVAALTVNIDPSGLLKLRDNSLNEDNAVSVFHPSIDLNSRNILLSGWRASVKRSLHWMDDVALAKPLSIHSLANHVDSYFNDRSTTADFKEWHNNRLASESV